MSVYFYDSPYLDGYKNLSIDRFFIENLLADDIVLLFYINKNAVIIGKNQNAYTECNLKRMNEDNVQLVRRHTGGGAVYHDMGNLNFSFICGAESYNLEKQFRVITETLKKLGIEAELSGRNDIVANGRKISGNAFGIYHDKKSHHGTILVNANLEILKDYLNVSETKLKSKGITSVRSRVANLSELASDIDIFELKGELLKTFAELYGGIQEYSFSDDDNQKVDELYREISSKDWVLGKNPSSDYTVKGRVSQGEFELRIVNKKGYIEEVYLYTDSLELNAEEILKETLPGNLFEIEIIAEIMGKTDSALLNEIGEFMLKNA